MFPLRNLAGKASGLGWCALELAGKGFDKGVAQDAEERLKTADILLAHTTAQLHTSGELVLGLVFQHGLAAADQCLPD